MKKRKPDGYWNNFNNCKEEALKYETRTELFKKSKGAYYGATKNGWLDEICLHMSKKSTRIWTYEKCQKEILKYKTKTEFREKSKSSYKAIIRYKYRLLDYYK